MIDEKCPNITWNKRTFVHSRFPTAIYFNFSVGNGDISFSSLAQLNLSSDSTVTNLMDGDFFDWNSNDEESKTITFQLHSNDKYEDFSLMEETPTHNEKVSIDNSHAYLDSTNLVTLSVSYSSISIDNLHSIPVPYRILSSTKIQSIEPNGTDILVLLLCNFEIVLIVFEVNNATGKVFPFVANTTHVFGLDRLHNNENIYRMNYSPAHNLLFLTTSTNNCLVYNIIYNENGIPSLKHSYNFETGEMLLQCFVPVSSNKDTFISLELEEDVLILRCISDLLKFKRSKIYFKNKFEIPLHMIPLKESSAILLLQESGYTVKSVSFCIEGEEREPTKGNYLMSPESIINSFYIPSRVIDFFNYMSEFDSSAYKRDQILVSSTDFCVYVIDVFYHTRNHQFETRMNKLFKYKANLTYFSFEGTDIPGEYLLEFYNEMGLCEKKKVEIEFSGETSTLSTVEEYWSEVCHHPILDFEFITELDKNTIENHSKEIWLLSGTGSNHSLMNFKHGYIAHSTDLLLDVGDFDRLYPHDTDKFWLCSDKRVTLVQLGAYLDLIVPVLEFQVDHQLIQCIRGSTYTKFITSRNILVTGSHDIEKCCSLSYECVLATGIDENSILLVKDDDSKYHLYWEADFRIQDISNFFVSNITDLSKVILLQFVTFPRNKFLIVGTSNSEIYFYLLEDLHFTQSGTVTILPSTKSNHISEYAFLPYQVHFDFESKILIVTSFTGEYSVNKVIIDDNYITGHEVLTTEKLADSSALEIIKNGNSIYLKGLRLWRLDYNECIFPKIVLMDDYNNKPILNAVPLHVVDDSNTFLAIKGDNVCILEVSLEQSLLSRSKNFGVPCMKIKFIPELRIFALIRFPGINSNLPHLLFADPKTMKVFKAETDLEPFFADTTPTFLHEWNIYDGSKKVTLLAICCSFIDGKKGAIKIAKITRSGNEIHLKHLHMFSSFDPITHISVFYDREKDLNHLLYSTGSTIKSYVYLPADKRSISKTIFEGNETIRKFYLTKDLHLHIVNQNQTCLKVKILNLSNFNSKEKFTSTELRSDVLPISGNSVVYSNMKEETLTITQNNTTISVDVGYLPRLAKVDWFPPWISLKERSENKYSQFVTVGLGGEVDLFTLFNDNCTIVSKEYAPTGFCPLKDYTSSKLKPVSNMSMEKLSI